MRRFSIGFMIGLSFTAGSIEASTLSALAASMASKTWVELSTQGQNGAMTGYTSSGCSSHLIEYADNGVWDPVHQKFMFLGAPHYCWPWKFIIYDDLTNQWSNGPLPAAGMESGGSTIGHGYDHNAVDPLTGDVYHKPYNSRTVYRFSNGSWSTFSSIPSNVMPSVGITGGLAYFPELNGLVFIQGADGGVYFCNKATTQWSRLTQGLAMGAYSNLIEYDRVRKRVYFGGGGTTDFYSLDTAKTVTKKANAPIAYANSNGGATMAIDPVTGTVFLFAYSGSGRYEYSPESNSWSVFSGATPPFSFDFNNINAPVSSYGVTLFATKSSVYLYRHAAGTGVEESGRQRANGIGHSSTWLGAGIQISPNPVVGRALCSVAGRIVRSASVYDASGRRMVTVNDGVIHTNGWAAGLYVVQVRAENKILSKRFLVQK